MTTRISIRRERRKAPPGESMASTEEPGSPKRCSVLVPVAVGELIDKITILEIKAERILDPAKRRNVRSELRLLVEVRNRYIEENPTLHMLIRQLKEVNENLWQIEDDIRERESQKDFGSQFIEMARSIYQNNDRRSELKRRINLLSGSSIVEEKSYRRY